MLCALLLVAFVDFQIAAWGATMRLWDESRETLAEVLDHDDMSGAVEPVSVPSFYRRQEGKVTA